MPPTLERRPKLLQGRQTWRGKKGITKVEEGTRLNDGRRLLIIRRCAHARALFVRFVSAPHHEVDQQPDQRLNVGRHGGGKLFRWLHL